MFAFLGSNYNININYCEHEVYNLQCLKKMFEPCKCLDADVNGNNYNAEIIITNVKNI